MALYCEDSKYFIKTMPERSVDMILTDPPYGVTELGFDKTVTNGRELYNALSDEYTELFSDFDRVLKDNGWLFLFGSIELASVVITRTKFRFHFEYVWEKHCQSGYRNTVKPFKIHECLYVFTTARLDKPTDLTFNKEMLRTKGEPYKVKRKGVDSEYRRASGMDINQVYIGVNNGVREGNSIIKFPSKSGLVHSERTEHPTQKPLALGKYLINAYTNKGDTVFDPFMGSGTFCVAAKELGRAFIGVEKDKEYFKMAEKRLSDAYGEMF